VDRDLTAMLYGVVVNGTGGYASLHGREAAGKTGTTQDSHDAWFVGFTTDYVAAAWVGNDDASPTRGVTGGTLPAYIWRDAMLAAEQGLPVEGAGQVGAAAAGRPGDVGIGRDLGWPAIRKPEAPSRPAAGRTQPRTERRHRGGLLGWLFGDDDDDENAAAAQPERFRALAIGCQAANQYKAGMIRRTFLFSGLASATLGRNCAAGRSRHPPSALLPTGKRRPNMAASTRRWPTACMPSAGGGEDHPGRTDVNVPQLLAGGAADFGMGSNSFISLNMVKTGVPIRAVMAIFQKDPQVLISHPRRDIKQPGRHARQAGTDFGGDHECLLALAEGQVRLSDKQIRRYTTIWRPSSGPNAIQEGYLTSEPFTIQSQAHFTPKIFLLSTTLSRLRQYGAWCRKKWIDTKPQSGPAVRDASRDGWLHYLQNPAKGNALIKRANPDISDAVLNQALDKMKRYEMLLSATARPSAGQYDGRAVEASTTPWRRKPVSQRAGL